MFNKNNYPGHAIVHRSRSSYKTVCSPYGLQHGVVLSEYLVGTSLVALALFMPVPVFGESVFIFILDSIRGFQANTTYLISLP